MQKYIINGGKRLKGDVSIGGAKNATWKLMVAATLTDEPVIIKNAARILDVDIASDIIKDLGGSVDWIDKHTVQVTGKGIKTFSIDEKYGSASRATLLFLGPLLHRFGKAEIPLPGGDKIGKRPIERHVSAFETLGVTFESHPTKIVATTTGLTGGLYNFKKNSHTGTENLLIASVIATGVTTIQNAALEPEVDNLIELLKGMGARVIRNGRLIHVDGVKKLHKAEVEVITDRNQLITFACAALITKGDIIIRNVHIEHITAFLDKLNEIDAGWELVQISHRSNVYSNLADVRIFHKGELKATSITTDIHPGFMSDWQALWCVLMTQANGISTIHEKIFESRFGYTDILRKMGARIELYNPEVSNPEFFYNFNVEDMSDGGPHAVKIFGPTTLKGTEYEVRDLRAGATVVLAALAAEGTSTITGIDQIQRGYQDFEQNLINLGADIKLEGD